MSEVEDDEVEGPETPEPHVYAAELLRALAAVAVSTRMEFCDLGVLLYVARRWLSSLGVGYEAADAATDVEMGRIRLLVASGKAAHSVESAQLSYDSKLCALAEEVCHAVREANQIVNGVGSREALVARLAQVNAVATLWARSARREWQEKKHG